MKDKEPNYKARRAVVGVVGAATLAGVGIVGYNAVTSPSPDTSHSTVDLNSPNAVQEAVKSGADDQVILQVPQTDNEGHRMNPTFMAQELGATDDVDTVIDELSSQVGGAGNMRAGDWVVVSKNQVNMATLRPLSQEQTGQVVDFASDESPFANSDAATLPLYEFAPPEQNAQ